MVSNTLLVPRDSLEDDPYRVCHEITGSYVYSVPRYGRPPYGSNAGVTHMPRIRQAR